MSPMTKNQANSTWIRAYGARLYWITGAVFFASLFVVRCGIDPTANKTFSVPAAAEDGSLRGNKYALNPQLAQQRPQISFEEIDRRIEADLRTLDRNTAAFTRYLTLTHLWNAGAEDADLETYRIGIAKGINHLSYTRDIIVPLPIDGERTIYRVDMRAYGWRRFFWDEIQRRNPYAIFTGTREERTSRQLAQSNFPVHARADWFTFSGLQGTLYNILMELPRNIRTLEFNLLRINADNNIRAGRVLRAGMSDSNVSQQNRIVERHETRFGYYWKSFDFEASERRSRRNIFEFALEGRNFFGRGFDLGGGEMIFSLPNGLQGYYATDANGNRIDAVPQNVAIDAAFSEDMAVRTAISCIACHTKGMQGIGSVRDEIRQHYEQNAFAFSRAEVDVVRALYADQATIDRVYQADSGAFLAAQQKAGVDPNTRGEPVSFLGKRFDSYIEPHLAAAEIGVTVAEFQNGIRRSRTLTRRLGPILLQNGTLDRNIFEDNFPFLVQFFGRGRAVINRGLFNLTEGTHGDIEAPLDDSHEIPELDVAASYKELEAQLPPLPSMNEYSTEAERQDAEDNPRWMDIP